MLKVALCIYRYFPFGGLQRDFHRFATELQSRGHHVEVFCISWEGEQPPGIPVNELSVRGISNHRRNQRFHDRLMARLTEKHFDLVFGFNKMPGLDVYFAGDSCYLDKALNERSPLYRLTPRFRHFAAYEAAVFGPQSDTWILLISETEKTKFIRHYQTRSSRLFLLPPGIDLEKFSPQPDGHSRQRMRQTLGHDENAILLLFVGSGFIKKGLDRAIKALAALPATVRSKTHLYVVGRDRERRYRKMSADLGVTQQVHFMGGRHDVPDFMQAADLLIHPALDEAAGIVILEAIASGLPVMLTDVCGYASHVAAARAGRVIASPFSQQILNDALREAIGDRSCLQQWRENARNYTQQEDLSAMHRVGADIIESMPVRRTHGNTSSHH